MVQAWCREHGLALEASEGSWVVVSAREPGVPVVDVSPPDAAEPEDFDEELAEAVVDPRWIMEISVPMSARSETSKLARSLARHLAERSEGAAFDPQRGRLVWPAARPRTPRSRAGPRETSILELSWLIAPGNWERATSALIPLLIRHAAEALPTRYGTYEPPQSRFDRRNPEPFVAFVRGDQEKSGFWYAAPPSFGGSFSAPYANELPPREDPALIAGLINASFDLATISSDVRWTEAVVRLFVRGAEQFVAFFAAGQVEPGWIVRGNRPFATAAALQQGEYFLRRGYWKGLPPVPVWLGWYGKSYRELVSDSLRAWSEPGPMKSILLLRRLMARESRQAESEIRVEARPAGTFVRLSPRPLPRTQLPQLRLPPEFTYRERRALQYPGGGLASNRAEPDDRARVIADLAR